MIQTFSNYLSVMGSRTSRSAKSSKTSTQPLYKHPYHNRSTKSIANSTPQQKKDNGSSPATQAYEPSSTTETNEDDFIDMEWSPPPNNLMIDHRIEFIVSGYIRQFQTIFPEQIIPDEISSIILSFIANAFSTIDCYTWKITDPSIINKILNAKPGDKFVSESFEMAKCKWKLKFMPIDKYQQFRIYLQLLHMSKNVKTITFSRLWRIPEIM